MTAPSFVSMCTIVSGWSFSGRGIITQMIVAARSGATKHFPSYHRLLSAASWSLDAMRLAVFMRIESFLGDVVMLGLDDTLARKRGLRMFGTGMHHDPLASTQSLTFVRWGHSWGSFAWSWTSRSCRGTGSSRGCQARTEGPQAGAAAAQPGGHTRWEVPSHATLDPRPIVPQSHRQLG